MSRFLYRQILTYKFGIGNVVAGCEPVVVLPRSWGKSAQWAEVGSGREDVVLCGKLAGRVTFTSTTVVGLMLEVDVVICIA